MLAVLVLFVIPFGSNKKRLLDLYRGFAGFSVISILSWVDCRCFLSLMIEQCLNWFRLFSSFLIGDIFLDPRFGGMLSKLLDKRRLKLMPKGESGGSGNESGLIFLVCVYEFTGQGKK